MRHNSIVFLPGAVTLREREEIPCLRPHRRGKLTAANENAHALTLKRFIVHGHFGPYDFFRLQRYLDEVNSVYGLLVDNLIAAESVPKELEESNRQNIVVLLVLEIQLTFVLGAAEVLAPFFYNLPQVHVVDDARRRCRVIALDVSAPFRHPPIAD